MKPEKTETLDYLQSHAVEIINSLAEHGEPLIIMQDGKPKAVLQDYASYEKTSWDITFLKRLAISEKQFREGKFMTVEEAFRRIRESTLSPVSVEN